MSSRIGELIIDSSDPDAAAAFWCAALDYRITDRDDTGVAISFDCSDGHLRQVDGRKVAQEQAAPRRLPR